MREIVTVVETERLVLRRFVEDDDEFVLAMFNDPDFVRFVGQRNVRSREQARAYIADRFLPHYREGAMGPFVVERRGAAGAIGFCSLFRRDWLDDADLGFAFLPAYRARGYAYEASHALMEHARDTAGLARLLAIVSEDNVRSARLLERLGFVDMGRIRPPDETEDVRLFAADLGAP